MPNKLLRIYGRVQGVGFRESMLREAQRLQLSGWVRNRHDGTVEALVCGRAGQVERMIGWAGQGPRCARVQRIVVTDTTAVASGAFEILLTE